MFLVTEMTCTHQSVLTPMTKISKFIQTTMKYQEACEDI